VVRLRSVGFLGMNSGQARAFLGQSRRCVRRRQIARTGCDRRGLRPRVYRDAAIARLVDLLRRVGADEQGSWRPRPLGWTLAFSFVVTASAVLRAKKATEVATTIPKSWGGLTWMRKIWAYPEFANVQLQGFSQHLAARHFVPAEDILGALTCYTKTLKV
jgi:hypothetical protein